MLPAEPVKVAIVGEFAGSDAVFFFYILLVFGVGQVAGAAFVFVGDQWIALVVVRHVCFFAVEVTRCVVVAAIGARLVAEGIGVPVLCDGV